MKWVGSYNLENIKAVQWDNIKEGQAIREFTEETKLEVVPTGLWLTECGFLGSGPDGLVGDNAIIEIKCPYKFREKLMTEELQTDHSYIVYCDGDELVLNKNYEYYHQIQGNLTICDRELCYLIIWTPEKIFFLKFTRTRTG
ncbi:hypothetical protein NQ314_011384 [Rhamnusium bicolor]|uniref:YqaJ viral recombinase domain-containing protein n=1 Tax=Rhamnusium bicolor TaxID=1586634 RepID=A0AAV8XIN7_9CUCU|nr:hypothetical protein NQ314_011384 [Rhamnusium bicolor]